MHQSAHQAMRDCVEQFVPTDRKITVVDLGSATSPERMEAGLTHGALFDAHDAEVIGVDVIDRPNVDVVLTKPYRIPLRSSSVDVIISGQVFEHIPYFWASMLEIARVLRPEGLFIMTAPSRGHPHMVVDCWRYYDDGVRAMAAFTGMTVLRAETDFPHKRQGPGRIYEVETDVDLAGYWGDTVGVLQKPVGYPTRRMAVVRGPVVWWANKTAQVFDALVEEDEQRKQEARARRQRRRKRASRGAGAAGD